ncbi:DMT family transporter [Clostridium hydrogenum]|uniref:DMT family transporter n=1 Tax=Clostridium hydrogenum TaxID=2855764 RepID=UPI001F3021C1|nr:DMT family transporter [Clostridium hydrogenum]
MKKGYLYIIFATILFSTMEVSLKMTSGKFNPIQLTFLRFFIGGVLLLPIAIKIIRKRKIKLEVKDFKFFLITGFICVVVSMILYQLAISSSQASIVAILFSCNPIFVIPIAYFALKEAIYKDTIISMVISVLGIFVILNPFNMSISIIGIAYTLLSALTFALYGIIGKKKSKEYGGIVVSSLSFILGSMELLIFIMISRINFVATFFNEIGMKNFARVPVLKGITLGTLPELIYIGIFVTGLGYTFYFLAMEETSASVASLVFYIKPALAPCFALIILKEAIKFNTVIGIVLILLGSSITFIQNSRRNRELEKENEHKKVSVNAGA